MSVSSIIVLKFIPKHEQSAIISSKNTWLILLLFSSDSSGQYRQVGMSYSFIYLK